MRSDGVHTWLKIPTSVILLYVEKCNVLLLFMCKEHCLQILEHMSAKSHQRGVCKVSDTYLIPTRGFEILGSVVFVFVYKHVIEI